MHTEAVILPANAHQLLTVGEAAREASCHEESIRRAYRARQFQVVPFWPPQLARAAFGSVGLAAGGHEDAPDKLNALLCLPRFKR
jgi:hypothetical protein